MRTWYGCRAARAHPLLVTLALLAFATASLSIGFADRQVVINTSPSVHPGIYVRTAAAPAVGTLVEFRLPPAACGVRPLAGGGGRPSPTGTCSSRSWPARATGSTRRATDCSSTAGRSPRCRRDRDGDGRPLPRWRASRRLGPDEFFAFSARIPNSFDSRCYGPVRRDQITAVRRLLWAW